MSLSKLQRQVLAKVTLAHARGGWYRAESSGERVTLASLYRARVMRRRVWRGREGEADAAHEYRLEKHVVEVLATVPERAQLAEQIAAVDRGESDGS